MSASTRAAWTWSPRAARTFRPEPMPPEPWSISPATCTDWSSTTTSPRPSALRWPATCRLTHARNGCVPSLSLDRFETFASSSKGDEARILHLPSVRYDVLDRPLGDSPLYWGLGSSLAYLSRSEPRFHARNVGRFDFYPHLSLPFVGRRMERRSRGRLSRHLLHHQPDSRSDRSAPRRPHHQPRSAQPD